MGFFDAIGNSIKESMNRKREERLQLQKLQQEAKQQQQIAFEQEFRQKALEVAKIRARRDAEKLSGINKLRALNRAERLTEPSNSFFSKMAEYTQKNKARREINLERTAKLRQEAAKMREEKLRKQQQERFERMQRRGSSPLKTAWD